MPGSGDDPQFQLFERDGSSIGSEPAQTLYEDIPLFGAIGVFESFEMNDATVVDSLDLLSDIVRLGNNASVAGPAGVAIGKTAETANGVSVGADSVSNAANGVAVGNGAKAPSNNATALGQGTIARTAAVAIGSNTTVNTTGVARIGSDQLVFGGTLDTIADADLNNGEVTVELDEANGAFRLRGKDSNGTIQEATISF